MQTCCCYQEGADIASDGSCCIAAAGRFAVDAVGTYHKTVGTRQDEPLHSLSRCVPRPRDRSEAARGPSSSETRLYNCVPDATIDTALLILSKGMHFASTSEQRDSDKLSMVQPDACQVIPVQSPCRCVQVAVTDGARALAWNRNLKQLFQHSSERAWTSSNENNQHRQRPKLFFLLVTALYPFPLRSPQHP